jgi:uncharacterized protein with HEPN domain
MWRREDLVRLRHMLDHAHEAAGLVRGRSRSDLDSDRVLNLALVRLLEIVGEAASRVSEEVRRHYQEIAWSQIVSLRHRLIHGYDSVDMDILWQILQKDIPPLITELERIVPPESK